MKNLFLVIVLFTFSLGCAVQEGNLIKDEPLSRPSVNIATPPLSLPPKVVYVDKVVQDPNSIKLANLVWDTSDNFKRIRESVDFKFVFDLGVAFQIGISDGFSGRKTTRDERTTLYPIIKEYSEKDKIKFIDLNVAYDGGFDLATKYMQSNRAIMAAPAPEPKDKGKGEKSEDKLVVKGRTGDK